MKQWMVVIGLFIVLTAGGASAQDTSPYVTGTWETGTWSYSDTVAYSVSAASLYELVNPTTKTLDVYAVLYCKDGTFCGCWWDAVEANGQMGFGLYGGEGYSYDYGAFKFFAFPAGTRKFDPNAVIGGFQQKVAWLEADGRDLSFSEANLKAVVINSMTIGEFGSVPPKGVGPGFCEALYP